MANLIDYGWVRIRYIPKRANEHWLIQCKSDSFKDKNFVKSMYDWAEKMIINNHYSKNDSVYVTDTNGSLLFGGVLYKDQKHIKDFLVLE